MSPPNMAAAAAVIRDTFISAKFGDAGGISGGSSHVRDDCACIPQSRDADVFRSHVAPAADGVGALQKAQSVARTYVLSRTSDIIMGLF